LSAAGRTPSYRTLAQFAMPEEPGVVEIPLPDADALRLWTDVDPLEAGGGNLPPALEATGGEARLVTSIRLRWDSGSRSRLAWAGINCVLVRQRTRTINEALPDGTGAADQDATLARRPVVPGWVVFRVTTVDGQTTTWSEIDDLHAAGPEVPVPDLRLPPGRAGVPPLPSEVFVLDAEAGV